MVIKKSHSTSVIVLLFLLGAAFVVYNANKKTTSFVTNEKSKIKITTSFYPLYYFASSIVGNRADVYNITPSGAEPHDYEPTATDLGRIESTDLLILNGNKLEAWGEKIVQTINKDRTTVLSVGEAIGKLTTLSGGVARPDPHIWLSPILAIQEARLILDALEKKNPADAAYYAANELQLENKLVALDTEYHNGLKNCQKNDIITAHAAFEYLANQYHLNQVPLSGLSPDQEPSPQELAAVSNFAKQHDVSYIFFESLVSPKFSETIAREVGAKTMVLNPIEGLTKNEAAMGLDYISIMRSNLANLRIALVCP